MYQIIRRGKPSHKTLKSPAPEANEDLAKAKFYIEVAGAKNAPSFGVRCTDRCTPGMSKIPNLSGGVNLWGESPLYVNRAKVLII